jgi:heme-binding protein
MQPTLTRAPATLPAGAPTPARGWLRPIVIAALTIGLLLVLIQLVPYGRAHTNPPVRQEPTWDSPETRALTARACFDCHSNETQWPWYTSIAPVSWIAQLDVERGRRELNFSEWDRAREGGREAAQTVQRGSMPPSYYVLVRSDAQLSAAERQALIAGLTASTGSPGRGRGGDD